MCWVVACGMTELCSRTPPSTVQEQRELRSKHSAEMQHVEARVKATLARREEVIAGLREQLAAVTAELGRTQAVLRQQQEELGDDEYD